MEAFEAIYRRACDRKGGEAALERLLDGVAPDPRLAKMPDDRMLSAMTMRVFQAGFAWRVIEHKWSGFEAAFHQFNITRCCAIDASEIERLAADTRIVRNRQKIVTVPANARLVADIAAEHGSFARWLAAWPDDDVAGLWAVLHKRGARLGGMTGPMVLRTVGKDTFLLSRDVVALLVANDVVTRKPGTRAELAAAQAAFNQWREESGRSLAEISRIASYSVGDNRVGVADTPPLLLPA